MNLGDIMSRDVRFCRASDAIKDCAKSMADNKIGFLPVVDDNGILLGTLTDRDIALRAVAMGKGPDTKVQDVMSGDPVHLHADSTLDEAEQVMMQGHIRRVVVVDDQKKPIGVVSISDIAKSEDDAGRLKEVLSTITERIPEERTVEELVGSPCCG